MPQKVRPSPFDLCLVERPPGSSLDGSITFYQYISLVPYQAAPLFCMLFLRHTGPVANEDWQNRITKARKKHIMNTTVCKTILLDSVNPKTNLHQKFRIKFLNRQYTFFIIQLNKNRGESQPKTPFSYTQIYHRLFLLPTKYQIVIISSLCLIKPELLYVSGEPNYKP